MLYEVITDMRFFLGPEGFNDGGEKQTNKNHQMQDHRGPKSLIP